MLDKVARVDVVPERTVVVPDRSHGRIRTTRSYTGIPEPGPNAPKLIRLIRNPVSQELGRPVANKDIPRRTATEWLKPESALLVKQALAGRGRIDRPRPTREPIGQLTLPRITADAWLGEDKR
mgnify:CR=1 FL=1